MKLTELTPEWRDIGEGRRGQGVEFQCPHCNKRRIFVPFENPLDGGKPIQSSTNLWKREGETFETLTLSPSINQIGHWHGWIRNGEVTNA